MVCEQEAVVFIKIRHFLGIDVMLNNIAAFSFADGLILASC